MRKCGIFRYIILYFAVIASLFPIIWGLITSIKPSELTFSIPPKFIFTPTLSNFTFIFYGGSLGSGMTQVGIAETPILFYLQNSVIVSLVSVLISLIIGSFAAYGLARLRFFGSKALLVLLMASRILPPVAGVVPLFVIFRSMRLVDTLTALIITYTAYNLPLAILLIRTFLLEVPIDLEESAITDGCTKLGAMRLVVLPLALPGLVATGIFSFLLAWSDVEVALFLAVRQATTAPVSALMSITESGILWGPLMAKAMVILLPAVIFTTFVQRHLIRGMTMGAVKG